MKYLLLAVAALCIGALGTAVYLQGHQTAPTATTAPVGGGFTWGQSAFIGVAGTGSSLAAGDAKATTTTAFLSTAATASTTLTGYMGRSTRLDLFVLSTPTSTASVLNFTSDSSLNNIDYYRNDISTTSAPLASTANTVQHASTEVVNIWPVATSTDTGPSIGKHFILTEPAGTYYRIRFGTTGANQAIWAVAIPAELIPN